MAVDPELAREQEHIELAYHHLDRMLTRAMSLRPGAIDPDLIATLKRRVYQLTDTGRPLCFGRIDTDEGEAWHIGRRHVEDERQDALVVEWRAPIAIPFYRATLEDAHGLTRRRHFVLDDRTIVQMADDFFGPDAVALAGEGPQVRGRDALLAELDRARSGQMLDIVATIQGEQDVVIRAPMRGLLCVQGGPGTGKTAIGLHRAAYLLYIDDALARSGFLVLGPNRTFLRYIAQVLPALGEETVVHSTLSDLVPDAPIRAVDAPATARLKGDVRMADVLRRSLLLRRQPHRLDADLEVRANLTRVIVERDAILEIYETVASRRLPYAAGRSTLRGLLARAVYERYAGRGGVELAESFQQLYRTMVTSAPFRRVVDMLWPNVSAPSLVRELLGNKARLAEAADGIFDADEQRQLARKSGRSRADEPWTEADGPLIDEAIELIGGKLRTYGYAVIDEAQDWSPMQARMLARRVPTGRLTILGDIAQGTGVWARDSWDDLLQWLPARDGVVRHELQLGYRTTAKVLAVASRLLPEIAPHLTPTESIRPGRSDPRWISCSADELMDAVAREAAVLTAEWPTVAVIVPVALHDAVEAALANATGMDVGDAEREGLDHRVTVVPALAVKGLEFDAVVVVEPSRIIEDAPSGLRLLYIALTRPTQHLSVVHAEPLPGALAGLSEPQPVATRTGPAA
jgi:DNA helicase IV